MQLCSKLLTAKWTIQSPQQEAGGQELFSSEEQSSEKQKNISI